MGRIRSKDTRPELLVRRAVWRAGFRYRLHVKGMPGRPDLVFPRLRTVVFVHGCYWHAHTCQKGRIPGANRQFWHDKFMANQSRDERDRAELRRLGWRVIVVWECALASAARRESTLRGVLDKLREVPPGSSP